MKLISENLHIISPSTKEAILNKDEKLIRDLLTRQAKTNPDWIDLNIGPARGAFAGTMKWLTRIVQDVCDIPVSFDSTNIEEIKEGLALVRNPQACLINSTSADKERLEPITDVCAQYNTFLVALTLNKEIGIPKESDKRLELAFSIIERCNEKNITNDRILLDPLILPVCVDQTQVLEGLNTIRMLKESFEPKVLTTIGLSNVSNGVPKELRGLINRVFMVLAMGCGLDSAIADSFDDELLRINKVITSGKAEKSSDKILLLLYGMQQEFAELSDVDYDKSDLEQVKIYKTAEILLNKKVYTHSYLEI